MTKLTFVFRILLIWDGDSCQLAPLSHSHKSSIQGEVADLEYLDKRARVSKSGKGKLKISACLCYFLHKIDGLTY